MQGEEDWDGEEGSYDEEENELGMLHIICIPYQYI
jgi:hypothetical protein